MQRDAQWVYLTCPQGTWMLLKWLERTLLQSWRMVDGNIYHACKYNQYNTTNPFNTFICNGNIKADHNLSIALKSSFTRCRCSELISLAMAARSRNMGLSIEPSAAAIDDAPKLRCPQRAQTRLKVTAAYLR